MYKHEKHCSTSLFLSLYWCCNILYTCTLFLFQSAIKLYCDLFSLQHRKQPDPVWKQNQILRFNMPRHNTHVANITDKVIRVVLTDNDARNSSHVLEPGKNYCFPTPLGRNTVSVFRQNKLDSSFGEEAEAQFTDQSDRSFIVKEVSGTLQIVRAKYGKIYQEETGPRWTFFDYRSDSKIYFFFANFYTIKGYQFCLDKMKRLSELNFV